LPKATSREGKKKDHVEARVVVMSAWMPMPRRFSRDWLGEHGVFERKKDFRRWCDEPENGDRKKSFCAEGMMHSEM